MLVMVINADEAGDDAGDGDENISPTRTKEHRPVRCWPYDSGLPIP